MVVDQEPIRLLIVEDHPVVREGLRTILESEEGMEVVGEAVNGLEAVAKTADLLPDVVLMDIRMPDMDGVEATIRIRATTPSAKVLMLTNYDADEHVFNSIKAGANGYLLKDVSPGELVSAIRAVAQGYSLMYPSVARRVLDEFQRGGGRPEQLEAGLVERLTAREQEVLILIAQGLSNRDIAERLVVSEKTVKTHITNIFSKLQLTERAQAVAYAMRRGLVK